jgi:lysophospholipase L1-like esterase
MYASTMHRILRRFVLASCCAVLPGAVRAQAPAANPTPPPPANQAQCAERSIQRQLERAATILADWPDLGRYREANAQLPPPARGEARVVFMGDSITDGWQQPRYGGFFPGKPYIDRGISGQTTPQMLIRFRPDVIALKPKAVVILAGTNDIAGNTGPATLETIEGNLASMAELARAHGIRVVLASVLPVSNYDRDPQGQPLNRTNCRPPAQISALNDWIRRYAGEQGHVYLDYYSAVVDDKGMLRDELSEDGLHPNARGYAVMAPLAEKAIARALSRAAPRSRAGTRPPSGRGGR